MIRGRKGKYECMAASVGCGREGIGEEMSFVFRTTVSVSLVQHSRKALLSLPGRKTVRPALADMLNHALALYHRSQQRQQRQ